MPAERADGRGCVGDSPENVGAYRGDGANQISLRDMDVGRRRLGEQVERSQGEEQRDEEDSHKL